MKRLKIRILLFCLSLSIPLGYFIFQTHQGLEQEELAELRYFADTLFSEMEKALADIVLTEEAREIDAYTRGSELSRLPERPFILGYFQNNPDGSFQSPLQARAEDIEKGKTSGAEPKMEGSGRSETERIREVVRELEADNRIFNSRRTLAVLPMEVSAPQKRVAEKKESLKFAEKYLDLSRSKQPRAVLGQASRRVEEISPRQALNLAKREEAPSELRRTVAAESEIQADRVEERTDSAAPAASRAADQDTPAPGGRRSPAVASAPILRERDVAAAPDKAKQRSGEISGDAEAAKLRVEVDPLQAVFLSDDKVMLFRRIVVGRQVFRQGAVILLNPFLTHLVEQHFTGQPMAAFTRLELTARDHDVERTRIREGAAVQKPKFTLSRTFPRPFSFLRASLESQEIPRSAGRKTLAVMTAGVGAVILLGLLALYHSARAIAETAERRSRFVSSVTHELKTPLTNIRMYIEMLAQKIAPNPQREQEYLNVLGSESARLSRLIDNVLEFSRIEKQKRRVDLVEGDFSEVIAEAGSIMQEKLRQEGFEFQVVRGEKTLFAYDREVMIQVLINLMENAVKFGRKEPEKRITLTLAPQGDWMHIAVADTGPGIPQSALKKIFHDFYRADTELTQATRGTGIGLALVHKWISAMGGIVTAENNPGQGCTFRIRLPIRRPSMEGRG